jgi:hypothetical protein
MTCVLLSLMGTPADAMDGKLERDCSAGFAGQYFGFADWSYTSSSGSSKTVTEIYLGPLGQYQSPVSAIVGALILGLLFALLVGTVLMMLYWRRRAKPIE